MSVHELGHSLGIAHSNVVGAVMYPTASRGAPYTGLAQDDILAIQYRYGMYKDYLYMNVKHTTKLLVYYKVN